MHENLQFTIFLIKQTANLLAIIYFDESCIKKTSDMQSTFTFIYRAVQKACLLTEVLRRKRENLGFYLRSDVIEQFHLRGITCDDYNTLGLLVEMSHIGSFYKFPIL